MTELTSLDGLRGGKFLVTTENGTTHTIDLDRKTIVRRAASPERAWDDDAEIGIGGITPDGEPLRFSSLTDAAVGKNMMIGNADEWRITSHIVSIVRI